MCEECAAREMIEVGIVEEYIDGTIYEFRAKYLKNSVADYCEFQIKKKGQEWGSYWIPSADLANDCFLLGLHTPKEKRSKKTTEYLNQYLSLCNSVNSIQFEKYLNSKSKGLKSDFKDYNKVKSIGLFKMKCIKFLNHLLNVITFKFRIKKVWINSVSHNHKQKVLDAMNKAISFYAAYELVC